VQGRAAVAGQAGPGPAAPPAADAAGVLQQLLTGGVGVAAALGSWQKDPTLYMLHGLYPRQSTCLPCFRNG
jgi:hypothetical protein